MLLCVKTNHYSQGPSEGTPACNGTLNNPVMDVVDDQTFLVEGEDVTPVISPCKSGQEDEFRKSNLAAEQGFPKITRTAEGQKSVETLEGCPWTVAFEAYCKGGGLSSLGFSFTHPKKEFSNLHPSEATPLVRPLAMQALKQCVYMTTNNSKRLPTSQSVLKTEINNSKY